MELVDFEVREHVAVMTLNSGENRFNPDFLNAFIQTINRIEKETESSVLVVTSAHEKIFSNGIDLEWLVPVLKKGDIAAAKSFFYELNRLFRRTLTSPMVTVAAINGHAFAGGAIWCCAFDFRFMRSDRGFFCLPEVDLGIPFLPGMNALLKKAIPMDRLVEMQLTGCRLTADQCEASRIVVKACHMDQLMEQVMAFARQLNKKRAVVKELKLRLYNDILQNIDVEDPPVIESGKFNIG